MNKLIITAAVIGMPFSAFSAVLFDQSTTTSNGYYSDALSTGGSQYYQQAVADNFSIGGASNVTGITFWGSSEAFFNTDLSNVVSFDISVLDSSFNSVFSTTVSAASLSPTATGNFNLNGGDEFQFTYNSNFNLSAGSYWLHVGATLDDPEGDAFVWEENLGDDVLAFNAFDGSGFDPSFPDVTGTAFRIDGQPVPEPASMSVLALGAAALIRRRRNRK